MRLRQLLKNVAFTLVVWAMLFVVAEAILRSWDAVRPRGTEWTDGQLFMCEPHPARIWQYKPSYRQVYRTPEFTMQVQTISWRLLSREVEPSAVGDPGVLRVLAIGDSFTFGWGVADGERFTDRLEVDLGAVLGSPVVVLNAGHWSFTLDQELLLARELVPRFRPHVVLQGLYAPGLLQLMSHRWDRDSHGHLAGCYNDGIRVGEDGALRFTNDYLEKAPFRSRVVGSVFRIWFNWQLSREAMVGDMALMNPAVTRYAPAWRMAQDVLQETGDYLRGEGVNWIAFSVPRDLQVSDQEWNETYRRAASGAALDRGLPVRRLGALVEKAGGVGLTCYLGSRPRTPRTSTSVSTRTGRLTGTP